MNRKDLKSEIDLQVIENGNAIVLDFDKLRKITERPEAAMPVIVQDAATKEVLLLAYANEQALRSTLESGLATFWSTSRNELWVKGKTSGDELKVVEVRVNCDQNSLLYVVKMVGKGSCHVKDASGKTRFGCYYRRIKNDKLEFIG
jgi:phosphoribosyl-AMP cyclohydrolase